MVPLVPFWMVTPETPLTFALAQLAERVAAATSTVESAVQEIDTGMLPVIENPLTLNSSNGVAEAVFTVWLC